MAFSSDSGKEVVVQLVHGEVRFRLRSELKTTSGATLQISKSVALFSFLPDI